jgi:hypothetical protein
VGILHERPEQKRSFFGNAEDLSEYSAMPAQRPKIGPQELLCAIFVLGRETRALSMRDLRHHFGVGEGRVRPALTELRALGLVQEEVPRLTLVGLATAVQLLPSASICDDGQTRRVA